MPLTNNSVLLGTLAMFALMATRAHASSAILVEQEYDNPHCRGAPVLQDLGRLGENVCYFFESPTPVPGTFLNVVDIATGKVVSSHADSLSFTCEAPSTYTGQDCNKHLTKTVGSYCLAFYDNNQFQAAIRLSCYPCRPVNTITKAHCNRLIQQCENFEIILGEYEVIPFPSEMKWTGRGCRVDGKPVGDGGCQCDGYCGYTCERACNADSQCYWDTNTNQCFSAQTNTPGEPIKYCLPPGEYEIDIETAAAKKSSLKFLSWFKSKP